MITCEVSLQEMGIGKNDYRNKVGNDVWNAVVIFIILIFMLCKLWMCSGKLHFANFKALFVSVQMLNTCITVSTILYFNCSNRDNLFLQLLYLGRYNWRR